ncbi:PIN domain protein [Salinispira pacifica]|uniref:PIN domain protein n=2 Tax=Salinispira pacifica TaxID=1307761 RepID=V5WFC5_9SPIO|nr:PIN domain protein [Salinispira pacifica]
MLSFNVQAQIDFLRWIRLGGIIIEEIKYEGLDRIISLSEKYSDIPMDLADASLVFISEKLNIKEIITIDNDYYIYRTIDKEKIRNIFAYE